MVRVIMIGNQTNPAPAKIQVSRVVITDMHGKKLDVGISSCDTSTRIKYVNKFIHRNLRNVDYGPIFRPCLTVFSLKPIR